MLLRAKPIRLLALLAILILGVSRYAHALEMGIDISHYQGTINWGQVAADPKNIRFAFMKASEDTNYTDPTFNTNLAGAKAAGILAGPYHFCRLDSNSSDPVADGAAEANYFLTKIKSKYQSNTYLPPVADIESWPTGLTTAALKTLTTSWTDSFSDTIFNALGVRPLVYTSQSKATSLFASPVPTEEPLWVAAWHTNGTASPPSNASVSPWSTWKFWQWSDDTTAYPANGTITGFASGIRVDRDVFNGSVAQLTAMLVGKDSTAKPGDFNRDGLVNNADYNKWLADNGKTVPIYSGADGNGDARVNSVDLAIWTAAVPEPGSCTLVLVGMCALAPRSVRSRRGTAGRM
jgi:GH25 family lysozyme M1 (1,4-beta-N-acetylmuramidase)